MKTMAFLVQLLGTVGVFAADLGPIALESFHLKDVSGKTHRFAKADQIIFMQVGSKCPIVRKSIPKIQALVAELGIESRFFFVNSSAHDTPASMLVEAKDFGMAFPILVDKDQRLAKALGFKMTAQTAVVRNGKIVYRGAIDDSINYGGEKPAATPYLKNAIQASLKNEDPPQTETRAYGCMITFGKPQSLE